MDVTPREVPDYSLTVFPASAPTLIPQSSVVNQSGPSRSSIVTQRGPQPSLPPQPPSQPQPSRAPPASVPSVAQSSTALVARPAASSRSVTTVVVANRRMNSQASQSNSVARRPPRQDVTDNDRFVRLEASNAKDRKEAADERVADRQLAADNYAKTLDMITTLGVSLRSFRDDVKAELIRRPEQNTSDSL